MMWLGPYVHSPQFIIMRVLLVLGFLLCVAAVWGKKTPVSPNFMRGMKKAFSLSLNADTSEALGKLMEEERASRRDLEIPEPEFNCDTTPGSGEPSNIHELRPQDVDLVAALGDSITAGFGVGAGNLPEVSIQNRGEAFSVGGDSTLEGPNRAVTLTNILRKWNPDVEGFSVGTGGTAGANSGLNRAVGGATNRNMLDQAENLVSRIISDGRYNLLQDWKVVTLFVGGNDLCASCRNEGWYGPAAYRDGIKAALDHLHGVLPRALVQVVAMFDVTPLTELSTGLVCDLMQGGFCNCVTNPDTRPGMRPRQLAYWSELNELINSGVYDTRDDFTVVLQPYMRDLIPPSDENGEFYKEFLSYDCFHPSRPAHQLFALYLWQSMLEPVGSKTMHVDVDINESVVYCPDEDFPYIYTNVNSAGLKKKGKVPKKEKSPVKQKAPKKE